MFHDVAKNAICYFALTYGYTKYVLYTYFLIQGYISLCKNTVEASFQKWNEKLSFSVSKAKFSTFFDSLEDQLISEGYYGAFISPKKWTFFVRVSALASKMGQIIK